ncbi:MAG: hypothetical protein OSA97_15870 [Nevskia sp.]|nr:hypothetical protein [Nevskia sp.]
MRFPVLTRFLIALGFLVVQTAAVVHATGHELKPETNASCEVCALAHAAGGTPLLPDASAIVVPRGIEPTLPAVTAVPLHTVARPHSRGPPVVLV